MNNKTLLFGLIGTVGLATASTGVAFLKIPVDARVCGVGEAAVANVDHAAALFYNPAGLGRIESFDAVLMHNEWLLDLRHEYVAAAFGAEEAGTFGLAFDYWSSGQIQGLTFRGETVPGYYFSATDWCLNLGYGRAFDRLAVGLGLKFVSERNESLATSAWAFDVGGEYRLPVGESDLARDGLKAGLSVVNVGTKAKLDQEAYGLPVCARLGWRYDWSFLGVTQDFILSDTERPGVAAGAECRVADILALRLGYRTGSDVGGLSGLRAGLGAGYRGLSVDYAFAPYGRLGMTHRLALSFQSRQLMVDE